MNINSPLKVGWDVSDGIDNNTSITATSTSTNNNNNATLGGTSRMGLYLANSRPVLEAEYSILLLLLLVLVLLRYLFCTF